MKYTPVKHIQYHICMHIHIYIFVYTCMYTYIYTFLILGVYIYINGLPFSDTLYINRCIHLYTLIHFSNYSFMPM